MNCLECTHIKTHQGGKEMARLGATGCALQPIYTYHNPHGQYDCKDFARAPEVDIAKRKEWAEK